MASSSLELALKISNQVEGTADVQKLSDAVERVGVSAQKLDAQQGKLDGLGQEMTPAKAKAEVFQQANEQTGA